MITDSFKQFPIGNSSQAPVRRTLPLNAVDKMADELVDEYSNPKFRGWYCGVIHEFGISKIMEWRGRAREGREPGKLFSKYVREARTYHSGGDSA